MMNRTMLWAGLTALTLLGGSVRAADRPDSWITTKVKAELATHKDVSAVHTKVQTNNGVVTLTGRASSSSEKELAENYVRGIEGVKDVDNRIVVGQAASGGAGKWMDDASITGHVKSALAGNKGTSALHTDVETKSGVVILTGTADTEAEKTLAERVAKKVKGVRSVQNSIEVK